MTIAYLINIIKKYACYNHYAYYNLLRMYDELYIFIMYSRELQKNYKRACIDKFSHIT